MKALLGLAILSPCVAVVAATHAGEDPKVAEARPHFTRGVELYKDGDFRGALIEFQRAYQIAPNFRILYNIGKANLELLDYPAALVAFERYLAEGGAEVPTDKRTEVEAEIPKLRQRVAYLTIECNAPGVEIWVDEVMVGKTPFSKEVVVGTGRHKISVKGQSPEVVEVAGGDHATVKLRVDVKPTPLAPKSTPSRTGVWVGVTVTSALLVGTGVFGYLALSSRQDFRNAADAGPLSASDVDDRERKIKRFTLTTDILAGATVLAGAVTLYYVLSRTDSGQPDTKVGFGPGSILLEGRF